MTPIDYIRIDAEILRLKKSDKAKLLLGLVKRFNNKGLTMSNPELGKLLNCSGEHIRIKNPRSRYRRIFYSNPDARVETEAEHIYSNNSARLLEHSCTLTRAQMPDIIKGIEGTKKKKDSLPFDDGKVTDSQDPQEQTQTEPQELPELLAIYQENYPVDPHRELTPEQQEENEQLSAAMAARMTENDY